MLNGVQNQPPSLISDSDLESIPPEKMFKKKFIGKTQYCYFIPSSIPGLSYALVNRDKWIYSIVPTDSQIVKKIDYHEFLSLKLLEAKLEKDHILKTIPDAIRDKNARAKETTVKVRQYYAQHCNDFAVRENCLWMDGRLAIPKDKSSAVLNRLHHKNFAAAKDVWIPLMHRNLAATAKYCKICLEAGKNLLTFLNRTFLKVNW